MINPFADIVEPAGHHPESGRAGWQRWKLLLLIPALALGLIVVLLPRHADAQVQIVDSGSDVPDYSVYYQALEAREAGDHATALRLFTEAAENGVTIAQYNLGVMYFTGSDGVTQDYQQAYYWTRKAAEQGHINAMLNLGSLYYNQLGVNPSWLDFWPTTALLRNSNFADAASWYAKAAEYDHGEAQYRLATMYQEGTGVSQDKVEALKWALLARDNENDAAAELVEQLQAELASAQAQQAQQAYARWVLEHRS